MCACVLHYVWTYMCSCVCTCMCAHTYVLVHAWVVHVCEEAAGVSARSTTGVSQELTGSLTDLELTKWVMLAGQ